MATKIKKAKNVELKGLRMPLEDDENVWLVARGWMTYRDQFLNSSLWMVEDSSETYFSLGYDSDLYYTGYYGPKPTVGSEDLAFSIIHGAVDERPFFQSDLGELPDGFDLTSDIIELGALNSRLQFDFMSTYISRRCDTSDYDVEIGHLTNGRYHDFFSVSHEFRQPELEDKILMGLFGNKLFHKAMRKRAA